MSLSARAEHLTEVMDDPSCDPERLRRTLERFGLVNRLVAGWGRVYRSRLRPALAELDRPARILDVGCGGGDVLRRVVTLSRHDGFRVTGTGIDPDARSLAVAEAAPPLPGVDFRRAFSRELVGEGARFDLVISNHLLHHLDPAQFSGLLADSQALATRLSVHSDIERGRLAYGAFALGILPLTPGSLLRVDGLRSIRRSYTRAELAGRLPEGWSAEHPAPFRLLAVHRPEGTRA